MLQIRKAMKNAVDNILTFFFFQKKIRFGISCGMSEMPSLIFFDLFLYATILLGDLRVSHCRYASKALPKG